MLLVLVMMIYLFKYAVDSDEVVTIENFSKMVQWFGPLVDSKVVHNIFELHSNRYFHGQLSSIQAEDLLAEKAKGTFLVRFSTSNPGIHLLLYKQSIKYRKFRNQCEQ